MKQSINSSEKNTHGLIVGQIQLTLFLGFIFALSFVLFKSGGEQTTLTFLRWYMGIFMLAFAVIKLLDYTMFALAFSAYDIVAKRFKLYAYIYPLVLLALAGLNLFDVLPYFRNWASLLIALVASIGVMQDVFVRRNQFSCGMVGKIVRMPFTTMSLVECSALFSTSAVSLFALWSGYSIGFNFTWGLRRVRTICIVLFSSILAWLSMPVADQLKGIERD